MKEIGQRVLSQNNRLTADPIFIVQERIEFRCEVGEGDMDIWIDDEGNSVDGETEEKLNELDSPSADRIFSEEEIDFLSSHELIGIRYHWDYVMCAFTEEGANEYIFLNGHRHRGKLRTYVDSLYRCPEMIAIRNFLIEQAKL
jgi:hypothetical protein